MGLDMYALAEKLFPINRSITGDGVRETLRELKKNLPELRVVEVPSGTEAFDWVVPDEWNVRAGWIEDSSDNRIVDLADNNLHVMGYSEPVNKWMTLDELQPHLHSLPDQPTAIPYVTSYYERRWGFCLADEVRAELTPGNYHVVIDSELKEGNLTYGELIIPGVSDEEVFISTYVCHPSMANNELSGPVVATALAQWVEKEERYYTYRFVFIPETIGSLVYLSTRYTHLQDYVVAGFNVTCVGDDRAYSLVASRLGDSYADRVAEHVLKHMAPDYVAYTYLDRGSDERQYCAPGINLPMVTLCRSKFGTYPEYHTSLDDMSVISEKGLKGSLEVLIKCVEVIENNYPVYGMTLGEPQMGRRGLYETVSQKGSSASSRVMMDVLAYADGRNMLELGEMIGRPVWELVPVIEQLQKVNLVVKDLLVQNHRRR